MKEFYSISELALSYNISTQTLRYYDKIGLLKPGKVDENSKYRMYGDAEVKQLYVILELKSMGLSLDDIKHFCDTKNVAELERILRRNNLKLQKKVKQLNYVIEHTQFYLDRMLLSKENDKSKLFKMQELPPQNVYMLNANFGIKDRRFYSILFDEIYYNDLVGKEPPNCGRYVVTMDRENFKAGRLKLFNGFGLKIDRDFGSRNIITMEGGLYAVSYHIGDLNTISNTFKALLCFIEESGYQVAGDLSWHTIIDRFFADKVQEHVAQVQVRIDPKPSDSELDKQ